MSEQDRMRWRRFYAKAKANHKCKSCGQPTDHDRMECGSCLRKASAKAKAYRLKWIAEGRCPSCGRYPEDGKKYCLKCLARVAARYQKRKQAKQCIDCKSPAGAGRLRCDKCYDRAQAVTNKCRDRLMVEVFRAYGGAVCRCCGENQFEFLSIDHVNGGDRKHQKEVGNVYRWLKKNGFPPGFQVLCMNCNWAKGKYGYCPHERANVGGQSERVLGQVEVPQ